MNSRERRDKTANKTEDKAQQWRFNGRLTHFNVLPHVGNKQNYHRRKTEIKIKNWTKMQCATFAIIGH